jgi:hypothetical protein
MLELALEVTVGVILVVGLVLMLRDTSRRSGRWGINLKKVVSPKCGGPTAMVRLPDSGSQALWGGRTCRTCGCKMDKWGRELAA